ncbi:MAG: hypothetical protein KKE51_16340 [Gammaproteobacteria bacterium]|nr:hypothetical protein [Gammaproteobacteria bacterium]MBU1601107.1 hypothetical protein [Gammaproteobacteria bacterium]MBU2434466.1 hypothetical protein [Gammaproteobacteria bacterium]MBU2450870.1 hypothetical protein [Gammaproteobacteria bacterium]
MRRLFILLLIWLPGLGLAQEALVVIGHGSLPKTELSTLQRLYTGRVVSIGEHSATPVNYPVGHPLREKFLATVLGQSEEQYTGYWLVRRYVGKGAPPEVLSDVDAVVAHIQATPGAVGYVPVSKVPAGGNVIFRR